MCRTSSISAAKYVFVFVSLLALVSVSSAAARNGRNENSVQQFRNTVVENGVSGTGCECIAARDDCGCCAHINIPKIRLNDTACVNVSYLPDEYGISLTVSIDGKIVFKKTVSAKNPPPICFDDIPYLEDLANICVDFYDLDLVNSTFSGCIKLQAYLYNILVEEVDLGCFHLPVAPGYEGELRIIYAHGWKHALKSHP